MHAVYMADAKHSLASVETMQQFYRRAIQSHISSSNKHSHPITTAGQSIDHVPFRYRPHLNPSNSAEYHQRVPKLGKLKWSEQTTEEKAARKESIKELYKSKIKAQTWPRSYFMCYERLQSSRTLKDACTTSSSVISLRNSRTSHMQVRPTEGCTEIDLPVMHARNKTTTMFLSIRLFQKFL